VSCEPETAAVLRDAGQKVTPQRMLILSCVRHAHEHLTASEILDQVRASYPYVDASTVYRTLASARDLRLVNETRMGSGEVEFEWVGRERHHHLICRACDGVTSLDSKYLDVVAQSILRDLGFRANMDHFAIFGICMSCREKVKE
jgi:Fur family ferric uptake transcriptional regulator